MFCFVLFVFLIFFIIIFFQAGVIGEDRHLLQMGVGAVVTGEDRHLARAAQTPSVSCGGKIGAGSERA